MRSSSAAWGTGEPSFEAASRFSRRGAIDWERSLDADGSRRKCWCKGGALAPV